MRLFILGGGGMLGRRVVKAAEGRGHQLLYPLQRDCSIEDAANVHYLVNEWKPDAIINCAGKLPDSDPLEMVTANALGPHVLASTGVRLIHMSTDCVYSGRVGAGRGPDPVDLYGRTKLAGESAALHVLNVRGSFIGPEGGFLHWLLEAEGGVAAWTHAYWNGSSAAVMAEKLVELAEDDRTGVVFVGSTIYVTKAWLIEYFRQNLELPITVLATGEPLIYRAFKPDIELPNLYAALAVLVEEIKASRVAA